MNEMYCERMINISVVVPIFNHWHLVPYLLKGVGEQELASNQFELILVDNAPDSIPTDLELPGWCTLIECLTPGSYAARNAGIAVARGQLLAFTDADCVPTPEWLSSAWRYWSDTQGRSLVAGGVSIEPADWNAMSVCEMYDVALGLPQQRYVRNGYAVTANLFIPRLVFEEIGFFDAKRFSGGDADFCRRATASGWSLGYCEAARVRHPARQKLEELCTKQRRVVGGQLRSGPLRRRLKYGVALMLPPARAWVMALRSKRLLLGQRLQVCGVVAYLKLVGLVEMLRLLLGGMPERR